MPNNLTSSHALKHTFLLCLSTRLSTLNNFVILCLFTAYVCITFSDLFHSLGLHLWLFTLFNTVVYLLCGYTDLSFLVINKILSYIKSAYYYQKVHII